MAKMYACLAGEWVDITNTDTLICSENFHKPLTIKEWFEKESPIRVDGFTKENLAKYHSEILKSPLIEINYNGMTYAINPIFIQLVY